MTRGHCRRLAREMMVVMMMMVVMEMMIMELALRATREASS
jgi:hypothetical protein